MQVPNYKLINSWLRVHSYKVYLKLNKKVIFSSLVQLIVFVDITQTSPITEHSKYNLGILIFWILNILVNGFVLTGTFVMLNRKTCGSRSVLGEE